LNVELFRADLVDRETASNCSYPRLLVAVGTAVCARTVLSQVSQYLSPLADKYTPE